jgi:hypothetical protein
MAKNDRYLHFGNLDIEGGKTIAGTCSSCRRVFLGKPNPGESIDDVLVLVRAEFEAHKCREDASQAAARIVREATEDR